MEKIILFYKYIDIINPQGIVNWQKQLCQELGLKGRVWIASEGVNGTLGGLEENIEKYKQAMEAHDLFGQIDFKESSASSNYFPKLKIKLKKEIVRLEIDPNILKASNGGKHLTPEEVHNLISKTPEDLVLLDARNNYESAIGTFENAITCNTNNFREFPKFVDDNLEQFKDKEVLMFCTGGIRCERASAYLKLKDVAKEVYQINGGIHRYVEKYPDGYFRGKNYVFDGRIAVKVTDDILATCVHCKKSFDNYTNCINAECNKQIIVCDNCIDQYHNTCSQICLGKVNAKSVNIRVISRAINLEESCK